MASKRNSFQQVDLNKKIKLELYTDSEEEPLSPSVLSGINEDPGSNESEVQWPNVWTTPMWEEKKRTYPWLVCESGKIGCSICSSVRNIQLNGVNVSKRWSYTSITYNGHTRTSKLASLRKKIMEHLKSPSHVNAEITIQTAKSKSVENVVNLLSESEIIGIQKIFTTAYYLLIHDNIDNDRFQLLLKLQLLNGIKISRALLPQFNINNISDIIACEMKSDMCRSIIDINKKIAILLDTSIQLTDDTIFALYLVYDDDLRKTIQLRFLDFVKTSENVPNTIIESMLLILDKYGFNHNYLTNNLISFASDGCDTLGRELGQNLNQRYTNIIILHCLNHRLQSGIDEAIVKIHNVNNHHSFVVKLYTVFNQSCKIRHEMQLHIPEIETYMNKYNNEIDLRNVSCSYEIVSLIWENHSLLSTYFESKIADVNLTMSDRNIFQSLYDQITSKQFVYDLALIHDVLSELTILAESLQKENISLGYSDKLMNRTMQYLNAMKNRKSKKSSEAECAGSISKFKTTTLHDNSNYTCIDYKNFITEIVNSICLRLFAHSDNPNIISDLDVLNPQNWPEVSDPGYGECEIESLSKRFKLSISNTITAFRDYLENRGKFIPIDLNPLLGCVRLIVYDSFECDRSIKIINDLIKGSNYAIDCKTLSNLLFIKLYGDAVESWDSVCYVNKWLENCNTMRQNQI